MADQLPSKPAALKLTHPLGALVGILVAALSKLGVWTWLDLSAEQVAQIGGAMLTGAALLAMWIERKYGVALNTAHAANVAAAYQNGLATPVPESMRTTEAEAGPRAVPDDEHTPVDHGPILRSLVVFLALGLALTACRPVGESVRPGLGALLSRVDVPSLLGCAKHLPDYGAAARCLGAEAATQGVQIALDRAVKLAEQAQDATGPAGADDYTDEDRERLATELDAALDQLAIEVDATHTEGDR